MMTEGRTSLHFSATDFITKERHFLRFCMIISVLYKYCNSKHFEGPLLKVSVYHLAFSNIFYIEFSTILDWSAIVAAMNKPADAEYF